MPRSVRDYARELPVLEVQATFYRLPSPATAARWRAEAPPGFEFTVRAPQLITHEPDSPAYRRLGRRIPAGLRDRYGFFAPSDEVAEAWRQTLEFAAALAAWGIVFQSPATFTPAPEHAQRLRRFFRTMPRGGLRLIWEPRGIWSASGAARLCEDLDLIHCVDPLRQRCAYGTPRYYRLHGRSGFGHRFTDEDLHALPGRCERPAYVLFNNASMWDDARRFRQLTGAWAGMPAG